MEEGERPLMQATSGILYTADMVEALMKGEHDAKKDLTLFKSGTIRVWTKTSYLALAAAVNRGTAAFCPLLSGILLCPATIIYRG
jgi:hypothetical protein